MKYTESSAFGHEVHSHKPKTGSAVFGVLVLLALAMTSIIVVHSFIFEGLCL